jgi:hypothetical protein
MTEEFWTMKNGEKISVDDMSESHLRATLKLIIHRNRENKKPSKKVNHVTVRGEMAQALIDEGLNEMYEENFDNPHAF